MSVLYYSSLSATVKLSIDRASNILEYYFYMYNMQRESKPQEKRKAANKINLLHPKILTALLLIILPLIVFTASYQHQEIRQRAAGPTSQVATTIHTQTISGPFTRDQIFNRQDLIYGSEIGAWDIDGGNTVNNQVCQQKVTDAKVRVIRFGPWHKFDTMGGGGTGSETEAQYLHTIDGIRSLGALPFIKTPPVWDKQCDGAPDSWTVDWIKQLIRVGGNKVQLYEFGNEPDNYCGWNGTTYANNWIKTVPAIKKYARSLGFEIFVGGPAWANSYPEDITSIQQFLQAVKANYQQTGDPDILPDFVSTHTYLTDSENSSQANAQSRITAWGTFYDNVQNTINQTFAGVNDKSGQPVGPQVKIADSEWNYTINTGNSLQTSQQFQDFYIKAMFDMMKDHHVWMSNQFTMQSHGGTALDMLNPDCSAKPEYNAYKAISSTDPVNTGQQPVGSPTSEPTQPQNVSPIFVCGGSQNGICTTPTMSPAPTTVVSQEPSPTIQPSSIQSVTPPCAVTSSVAAKKSKHAHHPKGGIGNFMQLLLQFLNQLLQLLQQLLGGGTPIPPNGAPDSTPIPTASNPDVSPTTTPVPTQSPCATPTQSGGLPTPSPSPTVAQISTSPMLTLDIQPTLPQITCTTTAPPPAGGYFQLKPVGSYASLPSDAQAAAILHCSTWEPRPDNTTYNHTMPTNLSIHPVSTGSYNANWNHYIQQRISGHFTGTTDEILQWVAIKWGLPDDFVRAIAHMESTWHQNNSGDLSNTQSDCPSGYTAPCPTTFGIAGVKSTPNEWNYGLFPWNRDSTAANADAMGGFIRGCYEGWITWLGEPSGDLWGCAGAWFSGSWHDIGANNYINTVKNHMDTHPWLQPGY